MKQYVYFLVIILCSSVFSQEDPIAKGLKLQNEFIKIHNKILSDDHIYRCDPPSGIINFDECKPNNIIALTFKEDSRSEVDYLHIGMGSTFKISGMRTKYDNVGYERKGDACYFKDSRVDGWHHQPSDTINNAIITEDRYNNFLEFWRSDPMNNGKPTMYSRRISFEKDGRPIKTPILKVSWIRLKVCD